MSGRVEVASPQIYIHGSQQMIGKLFDEARAKAPTVLCFDEFVALVPSRKVSTHATPSCRSC